MHIVKRYHIIQHDFKNDRIVLVYNGPLIECQHKIEELAENFIIQQQGNNDIHYYNPNDKNRVFGYFIQRDNNKINKLFVKKKYNINGYIYNSTFIENYIAFEIITSQEVIFNFYNNSFDQYYCKYRYDQVMNQLRNTINFFNKYKEMNFVLEELKLKF